MGGSGESAGLSMTVDSNDNLYLTGFFDGTVDFDPSAGMNNHTSAGGQDIFLTRINADGSYGWTKTMGGPDDDNGFSVAVDGSGDLYVTGYFRGTVDFDPGDGMDNHTAAVNTSGYDTNDIFLTRINADGSYGWTKTMGGSGEDSGLSVVVDNSGKLYVTGGFSDAVDFNPGPDTDFHGSAGNSDIFISKFSPSLRDSDRDGMDDDWEILHFGDLSHDGSADTDVDGLTDLQEFRRDSNPNTPEEEYNISANADANGSISPAGDISVTHGDSQGFTIIPDDGYEIVDVLIDGISRGAITEYTFDTVAAPHSISATFTLSMEFTISASAGMNGSISPAGDIIVSRGDSQSFNISPDEGYKIINVMIDGIPQGGITEYTFTNVTAPHSILATFALLIQFPISATIAANEGHSLVIKQDGTLWAWGENLNGQLGDGTITKRPSPVQVGASTDWLTVTAGNRHSLGIRLDGTLWAWGYNRYGQLGDGSTTDRHSPLQQGTSSEEGAVVAAAVWTYQKQVGQDEVAQLRERQLSARRIYFYLMSFLGLGTLIAGLIIVLGILLELLTNAVSLGLVTVSPGWWRQQLSLSLALLLVALPIWVYYWSGVLRMVAEGGVAERVSRSRRIFIYVIVGVAIITLAADLVNIVYQSLNGLLQGAFGAEVLRGSKWSLQTLVVAIPVLWYHWHVLRQDQRLGAEKLPLPKTVTMLAGEPAAGLVSRIEERLGSPIRRLRYLGRAPKNIPDLSDEKVDELVGDIKAAPGDKVMLVIAGGKVVVLPYQEK